MKRLIMLAVLGAGLTLAGTSDAEANHRWRGGWGWGRPSFGHRYFAPRYYGYSYYAPRYYGYNYYAPRHYGYSSYDSPWYGGYGYRNYGYYPSRGFNLYIGPGGVSFGYNRFRW